MSSKFDLNQRLQDFTVKITLHCRNIYINFESRIFISQLIRSASSIGANYSESFEASTAKDRFAKLSIARKEEKKTLYWIQIISRLYPNAELCWYEAEVIELCKILATIQSKISKYV